MSDKITELKTRKTAKHPVSKKRVVLLVVIAVVVCSILSLFLFSEELNLDRVRRWFKYLTVRNDENYGSYSFDSHSSNCYENLGDGLAVASISGLNVYDPNGEELFVDFAEIAEECQVSVLGAKELGIVLGDENNCFNPKANLTRAEAATMIFRMV